MGSEGRVDKMLLWSVSTSMMATARRRTGNSKMVVRRELASCS